MKQPLHVLHIEDSEEDSELINRLLSNNGIPCEIKRVETRSAVFDALQTHSFDLILSDCKLPGFSGHHALEIAHALKPEIPFVFVSGTIGEETAIESLRNGATDYVLKDRLNRLVPAIRRAMTEAEERMLCRQLQQRLREAGRLEAIGALSNGIAHDFNNILTIILGHTSLLNEEKAHPERVLEISETISEAARRASEIVEQLLAFARKSEGHVEPIDLNPYLKSHLELMKKKLHHQVILHFEPNEGLPPIRSDARQLERILLNLVTNAVDSMPDGGRLTFATSVVSAASMPELLPELESGRYVCLKVTDEGMGMDAMTRDHVFEPFYTTKERGRGTGLGLPVVFGLMQSQQGCIDVQSEPGQGTIVSLYFPVVASPEPVKAKVPRNLDPNLCGSEPILIIEDEPDVSFFVKTILEKHGHPIFVAHNHAEALELFEAHRSEIQLVFSDIGLPKIDGINLCAKLKALKPELRVILASGYSPKEFKARMDKIGADGFLSKPYHTRDLLLGVRKVLDTGKSLQPA